MNTTTILDALPGAAGAAQPDAKTVPHPRTDGEVADGGAPRATGAPGLWRRQVPTWGLAALLGLTLAHLLVLDVLTDPADNLWILTFEEASSFHLWQAGHHPTLASAAAFLVGLGLLLRLLASRHARLSRPARVVGGLAGATALLAALLPLRFWELGLGLSEWTWALPLRGAVVVALGAALALLGHPALRWPRFTLAAALLAAGLLLLAPRSAEPHRPAALVAYCELLDPGCDVPPEPCRGALSLPAEERALPARRMLTSLALRARARARLAERITLLYQSDAPKGWTVNHRAGTWKGSQPFRQRRRMMSNAWLHLVLQDVRLLGLGLLLLVGLPLGIWLVVRRAQDAPRRPLAFVAITALVAATGLLPEWSHVSLTGHLPYALLLPAAVLALVSALVPTDARAPSARPRP